MVKTTVIISLLKDTWLIDNIISPVMQAGLNICQGGANGGKV